MSNYDRSIATDIVTKNILYYKTPVINQPTISYDKKLTKKSSIRVNQYVNLYKHDKFKSCRIGLYKD